MSQFPAHKIKPKSSVLTESSSCISIEIILEPFELDDLFVDTSIRLDMIDLPTTDLSVLAGRNFEFPVNPEPGYIDGSVYIEHAHHPVDVTHIRFGEIQDGKVSTEISASFVLNYEGLRDYDDFEQKISCKVQAAT